MPTTEEILAERAKTHGSFDDNAAIMQKLKAVMKDGKNWHSNPAVMKEALEMIAHKIGRILTGDPFVADHWDDIAGYAKLVSDRCPENANK